MTLACDRRNISIANPDLLPSPSMSCGGANVPHTWIAPAILKAPRVWTPPERNRQRFNAGSVIGIERIVEAPETRRRSVQSQAQAHEKNLLRETFTHATDSFDKTALAAIPRLLAYISFWLCATQNVDSLAPINCIAPLLRGR
jgi:hypothetical protein